MKVARKLGVGDVFYRDDYHIKITDMREIIELDGTELWRIGTEIYVDDMLLMTHGFKVAAIPDRRHFTLYADKWVPQTIINFMNKGTTP